MSNPLTRRTTLGIMPQFLGILVRHYYDRLVKDAAKAGVPLRHEELLYDEAFSIAKKFMEAAVVNTVEDLQGFTKLRTPAPPSVHVVRLNVPISCCDEAAQHLIKAMGGEEVVKQTVGGTKWWQVRGIQGVDSEWIATKKDWQQSERRREKGQPGSAAAMGAQRHGSQASAASSTPSTSENQSRSGAATPGSSDAFGEGNAYRSEMDEMRCILWIHGGGYYFGSVDQERYMIQRYARKINGRVFSPNYRLAPQYPFPCALQDCLAAYLFLIRPPEGAAHRPVHPNNIVIAGDSAGGGLAIAILQIIRDSGLPPPAGGVLVSPWCDLFHSFPSIFLNTDTDIVPSTGLTLHKPSMLWPPPPEEVSTKVHDLLRNTVRGVINTKPPTDVDSPAGSANDPDIQPKFDLAPAGDSSGLNQTFRVNRVDGGQPVVISRQIQMYTTNALLKHPLVSPVLAYLGGLPPLFIIASDKEALRDEIIYAAHRAAHPEQYPIMEDVKKLYPAFEGIETKMTPTTVHLQVYDDAAHVLPLMFSATTPAKYCYRAIATFIKHVTGLPPTAALQKRKRPSIQVLNIVAADTVTSPTVLSPVGEDEGPPAPPQAEERPPLKSSAFSQVTSTLRRGTSLFSKSARSDSDVAGPRFGGTEPHADEDVLAGDPIVYHDGWANSPQNRSMIRERVAINGAIRPLEDEKDLPALQIAPELVGKISERWIWRYLAGTERHEKKYTVRLRDIARRRERAAAAGGKDLTQRVAQLQQYLAQRDESDQRAVLDSTASWSLAWALDGTERPPPSSIVARRDTAEALRLARVADQAIYDPEHALRANNLWSATLNFLTASPEKPRRRERAVGEGQRSRARAGAFGRGRS
ncbi:hypothetical protein BC834DRAFT_561739 [Gloeopeniophorella convolvens]|nr:hypothetical protein BC834DRAFT_561739 [Gloeopeniophorella convolvens]